MELRQLKNSVEIIGTIKALELKETTSRAGNQYIGGKIIVSSEFNSRINEVGVKVMIMASSKLYAGIKTVMDEYKSIDAHGKDIADRIKITGELAFNEYFNKEGKLAQFNEVKGIFFTRLEKDSALKDKAVATIDTIIEAFVPKLDADQLPTGELEIKGYSVGWKNSIIELKNTLVSADLAEPFQNLYTPGQTAQLTYRINNYALIEEAKEEEKAPVHGFGTTEKADTDFVFKKYVSNYEIIGGDMPYFGTIEYTPEEIEEVKRLRKLTLDSLSVPVPELPAAPTGFGSNGSSDSMPDF